MAAPANGFAQGLLQSLAPWMSGANPSGLDSSFQQYGGTQGLLDAMLQANTPGNLGRGMEGVQNDALTRAASRQQLAQQGMGLQFQASRMPLMLAAMRQRMSQFGLGGPATTAQPNGTTSGGPPPSGMPSLGGSPTSTPATDGTPPGLLSSALQDSILGMPWASAELSAAKTGLQYDPAIATQMALAKDPLTLDRAAMSDAQRNGDAQGYISAYTKMLTDANRLHISSMSGNVTGFGLPPWVLQSMANYNPQSGKITANGRQSLIPGAADTEAQLAAAREGAETAAREANTPTNIPTGGGGSRFGYIGDVIGAPPALRGKGVSAPVSAPPAQNGSSAAAQPKVGNVWDSVPKLDIPQNVGEADYFTRGRLQEAGKADVELGSQLSTDAATADQQLEYNREAMRELPVAEVGPLSEWLTHFRSALVEAGVPEGLIPKDGTVTPTQELNKSLMNAALQGARQLYGSRMTQTEVKLQTDKMSPSASMTRDAISSLMQQNNIRQMYAKARAADYVIYRQRGGDPTRYEAWYATKFPIQKFAVAVSKMTPQQMAALSQQQGGAQ